MRARSRKTLTVAVAFAMLCGSSAALPAQGKNDFQLSLTRQYGHSTFSECRLDFFFHSSSGTAQLVCDFSARDAKGQPVPSSLTREEQVPETKQIADAVQRSGLYDGEHVGIDTRPADGNFETLTMRTNDKARTVVLVISGNRSFEDRPARKELLSLLEALEKRLTDQRKGK
jgi:hypothetical protein